MKEEWKQVVVNGKVHPWYSISNYGNVVSHLRKRMTPPKGSIAEYDPEYRNPRTPKKDKSGHYKIDLTFPQDFFEDWDYRTQGSKTTCKYDPAIHKLVMEAFRPMDEYPPERLKDCWDDIPEDAKTWIKQTVVINHIDHNPTNNYVDNLEYVTPRENSRAATKHYGGNVVNKSKQIDPIVIHDGRYNPVLQEWEDTQVEFVGKEGEELHKKLLAVAEKEGIDPGQVFVEALQDLVKTVGLE